MDRFSHAILIGAVAMLVPTSAYASAEHPEYTHSDPSHGDPSHPTPVHPGHDPHSAPAPIAGAGLGALLIMSAAYYGLRRKRAVS